jgi:hypothetical protein
MVTKKISAVPSGLMLRLSSGPNVENVGLLSFVPPGQERGGLSNAFPYPTQWFPVLVRTIPSFLWVQ